MTTNLLNTQMENKTNWSIDRAHSEIAFKVRHLMIAHVKGQFKIFDAVIYTTGNDFTTAEIDLSIEASSITTGDEKRDEHLKSVDFFDVQVHKQIKFISSGIERTNVADIYQLSGELTMKGITKKVKLKVQFGGMINDPSGNEKAGFTVAGKINRSDWELAWNAVVEAGGLMVSEEVKISCEVELFNADKKPLSRVLEAMVDKNAVL